MLPDAHCLLQAIFMAFTAMLVLPLAPAHTVFPISPSGSVTLVVEGTMQLRLPFFPAEASHSQGFEWKRPGSDLVSQEEAPVAAACSDANHCVLIANGSVSEGLHRFVPSSGGGGSVGSAGGAFAIKFTAPQGVMPTPLTARNRQFLNAVIALITAGSGHSDDAASTTAYLSLLQQWFWRTVQTSKECPTLAVVGANGCRSPLWLLYAALHGVCREEYRSQPLLGIDVTANSGPNPTQQYVLWW